VTGRSLVITPTAADRRAALEASRPDAVITWRVPYWTGSLTVCRKRFAVSRTGLAPLLDELGELAALDAESAAVETAFPGWRVWLSSVDRWWAVRQGPDGVWSQGRRDPITVSADDLAGLRGQLADAQDAADAARAAA
jgi:hypothetical protein